MFKALRNKIRTLISPKIEVKSKNHQRIEDINKIPIKTKWKYKLNVLLMILQSAIEYGTAFLLPLATSAAIAGNVQLAISCLIGMIGSRAFKDSIEYVKNKIYGEYAIDRDRYYAEKIVEILNETENRQYKTIVNIKHEQYINKSIRDSVVIPNQSRASVTYKNPLIQQQVTSPEYQVNRPKKDNKSRDISNIKKLYRKY